MAIWDKTPDNLKLVEVEYPPGNSTGALTVKLSEEKSCAESKPAEKRAAKHKQNNIISRARKIISIIIQHIAQDSAHIIKIMDDKYRSIIYQHSTYLGHWMS